MNDRLKHLLIVLGLLCVVLLGYLVYTYTLHADGWYCGPPEEGIARYAEVQQENVQICQTQQKDGFLYAVWEDTATNKISMKILKQQKKLGRSYLRPWGASPMGDGAVLDTYRYSEGDGASKKSLVVVICDNRSGSLDHCNLTYITFLSDDIETRKETMGITGPFLLHAQWLPGYVHCAASVVDSQGNIVEQDGGYSGLD